MKIRVIDSRVLDGMNIYVSPKKETLYGSTLKSSHSFLWAQHGPLVILFWILGPILLQIMIHITYFFRSIFQSIFVILCQESRRWTEHGRQVGIQKYMAIIHMTCTNSEWIVCLLWLEISLGIFHINLHILHVISGLGGFN